MSSPGYFGQFGGRFVAETLVPAHEELSRAYREIVPSPEFQAEWRGLLATYVGRETPLSEANRLRAHLGTLGHEFGRLWLKREDLNHTGAHKINNALGQVLLAKKLGKTRIIAETGAGQHGVATATACALLGIHCEVYMGSVDIVRQSPNVGRMKMLGAKVISVESGSKTLKDAMNEALRDWVTNVETTHYCVGSAAGPAPFPDLVRDFQRIIGEEARAQALALTGELPDAIVACVGGGSNAIGMFAAFLPDLSVSLYGVEAAGFGLATGQHAAPLNSGSIGVLHGSRTRIMQDENGQILETHSVSAGLDYPGVGPEHAYLQETGRAVYLAATDDEALDAAFLLTRVEGIIPALESSHALAALPEVARRERLRLGRAPRVALCLSGRGDKDLATYLAHLGGNQP